MNNHKHSNPAPQSQRNQFSATNYREAMGPGYSVALFKEQHAVVGRGGPPRLPRSRPTIVDLGWSIIGGGVAAVLMLYSALRRKITPTTIASPQCC